MNTIEEHREAVTLRRKLISGDKASGVEADIDITNQLVVRAACTRVKYQYNLLHDSLIEGVTGLPGDDRTTKPAGLKNAMATPAVDPDIDSLATSLESVVTDLDPEVMDIDTLYDRLVDAETTFKKAAGVTTAKPGPAPPIEPLDPGMGGPSTPPENPVKKPAIPGDMLLPG